MSDQPFIVQLYNDDDQPVGEPFPFGALPYRGLVIAYQGDVWQVSEVMAVPAHPRSPSGREGIALVDCRVVLARGIHRP